MVPVEWTKIKKKTKKQKKPKKTKKKSHPPDNERRGFRIVLLPDRAGFSSADTTMIIMDTAGNTENEKIHNTGGTLLQYSWHTALDSVS